MFSESARLHHDVKVIAHQMDLKDLIAHASEHEDTLNNTKREMPRETEHRV